MNVGATAFRASYCCVTLKLSTLYQPAKAPVNSEGKVVAVNIPVNSVARQLQGNGWKFPVAKGRRKSNNSSDMWWESFHNLNKR